MFSLLFILFVNYISCSCQVEIFNKTLLTQCDLDLNDIINHYFMDRKCLTIIYVDTMNKTLDFINLPITPRKVLRITEKDYNSTFIPKYRPRRDNFTEDGIIKIFCQDSYEGIIIFASSLEQLKNYTFGAKISPFLSAQSKFFIILQDELPAAKDYEFFFEKIWKVFKVVKITIANSKDCKIYYYNPVANSNYKWGVLSELTTEEVKLNRRLIENDLLNLNKYPFKAIVFFSLMAFKIYENNTVADYGGMDGLFFDLLAKYMNFTKFLLPKIPNANYGQRLPNGSFDGALKYLVQGEIEFICVGYFLKDYLTRDIEFASVAFQDDLCVVVHKGTKMPIWEIFYVTYEVWALLFCCYFIIAFIWSIMQKFEDYMSKTKKSTNYIFLETFRLMIATSFTRSPVITSEKVFLVFCMMSIVTFLGAFQGSLMTIFSTPSYYPDVKSLDQLAEKNFPIYTRFEAIKNDVFGDDSTNPTVVKLRKMVQINKQKVDTNSMIAKYGNCAGLSRRSSLHLDNSTR